MTHEGHFTSADGLDFFERRWDSESAGAHLILLHGYAEHSGRYAGVAAALNGIGVTVHTYDQRGHGRSAGKRGYVGNFDLLVSDLEVFIRRIRPQAEGRPLFLMGHSMGGLVLAAYAVSRGQGGIRPAGLIFSSPFLAIKEDVSSILIALARVLSTLTPWLPVARVNASGVSRDPEIVRAYETDPLVYQGPIRARTGAEFNAAIQRVRGRFDAITDPVFILHGSSDSLVPAAGSRYLYENCGSADKTLRVVEGGYHELFNDLEKHSLLAELCQWVAGHCRTDSTT